MRSFRLVSFVEGVSFVEQKCFICCVSCVDFPNRYFLPPDTFKEMAEETFGLSYQDILFKTGKELRDIVDRKYRASCMESRTLADQNYVPRKQKLVTPAMKWKVPISKPKEFKISVDPHQSPPPFNTQTRRKNLR